MDSHFLEVSYSSWFSVREGGSEASGSRVAYQVVWRSVKPQHLTLYSLALLIPPVLSGKVH